MSLIVDVEDIVAQSSSGLLSKHETWRRVPLGSVAAVLNGFAFPSSHFHSATGTPLIRIRDIASNRTTCFYRGDYDDRYVVNPGDLLVGMDGDFTVATWRGPRALLNQRVCKISVDERFYDRAFLGLVLPGYLSAIHDRTSSQTVKHLSSHSITEIPLPLPPLAEQRRIAEKVGGLLEQANRAHARLDNVPLILKRLRLAVLAAACTGELTKGWRSSLSEVGSANDLLRAIAANRTKRGLPTATKSFDDEGIDIPEIELPNSWVWTRVGNIADVRLGGTPSRKEPGYWGGRIPWVSSGEVANCRILKTTESITKSGIDNSNAKLYPTGTVLIAMIGEGKTRGQAAILDIAASTNQNVAGLVFDAGMIVPEYVWLWALGEYEKNRQAGRGGNQPALNCGKVRALPLPLPPFAEQVEVVRVVKTLLSIIDTIGRRLNIARKSADMLPRTILSRAFRGALVSTEAELATRTGKPFETADALLVRLRASHGVAVAGDSRIMPRRQKQAARA